MEQSKFYQIKNITEHEYTLVGCDGSVITRPIQDVDKSASAFTIQDAKNGDVLAAHECLVLFKEIDGLNIRCYCTYHYTNHQKFYVDTLQNKNVFCPATKEQRDLLFQKMKEAGYEWDAEKKELKKIAESFVKASKFKEGDIVQYTDPDGDKEIGVVRKNNSVVDSFKNLVQVCVGESTMTYHKEEELELIDMPIEEELKKFAEEWDESLYRSDAVIAGAQWYKQRMKKILEAEYEKGRNDTIAEMKNHAWSEEDEMMLEGTIDKISDLGTGEMCKEWLKSLKDRVQPQPKREWSKEDENHVNSLLERLEGLCRNEFATTRFAINEDEDWLKSLRPQPRQEILEKLEEWLDEYISDLADVDTASLIGSFTNYLDGKLPVKPKNRWKPSDEQIQVLQWCMPLWIEPKSKAVLESLLDDLKKLRDE